VRNFVNALCILKNCVTCNDCISDDINYCSNINWWDFKRFRY